MMLNQPTSHLYRSLPVGIRDPLAGRRGSRDTQLSMHLQDTSVAVGWWLGHVDPKLEDQ